MRRGAGRQSGVVGRLAVEREDQRRQVVRAWLLRYEIRSSPPEYLRSRHYRTLASARKRTCSLKASSERKAAGSERSRQSSKGYRADAAIIMEPTRLMMCPVQAGALTFRIKVPGQAIHASMKRSGVSAIEKFYSILDAVNRTGAWAPPELPQSAIRRPDGNCADQLRYCQRWRVAFDSAERSDS